MAPKETWQITKKGRRRVPLRKFCCSICGVCAPKETLKHGKLKERMAWLRSHRKAKHPAASKKKTGGKK